MMDGVTTGHEHAQEWSCTPVLLYMQNKFKMDHGAEC